MASIAVPVVGWLAAPAISSAVGKIRSLFEDRSKMQEEAKHIITDLAITLEFAHTCVNKAEPSPAMVLSNECNRHFSQEFLFTAIDVENLVDIVKVKIAEQRRKQHKRNRKRKNKKAVKAGKNKKVGKDDLIDVPDVNLKKQTDVISKDDLKQLKNAKLRLDKMTDQLRKLVGESWMSKHTTDNLHLLTPMKKVVIGREAEADQVLNLLLSGSRHQSNPRLICMVGRPGVGKSCLSRLIFENPDIRIYFDLRGWMAKPNPISLFDDLVAAFTVEAHADPANNYNAQEQLSCMTKHRRFLIVIDNASDSFDQIWTALAPIFATAAPGSAVLAITESAELAAHMATLTKKENCVMLCPLPQSVMCSILEHHSGIGLEHNELKAVGKKICSRLHGLPLLAELIGRLLCMDVSKNYWQSVMNNPWWDRYTDSDYPTLAAMSVISENLPVPLKNCLGYSLMFLFPEGCSKNKLLSMWSQNFVYDVDITSSVNDHFNALVNLGLLQQFKNEDLYTVHELVYATAAYIDRYGAYGTSYKDSYRSRANRSCDKKWRHIAVDVADAYLYCGTSESCSWRTLVLFDRQRTHMVDEKIAGILSHTDGLRVLDLSTIHLNAIGPPHNIQYMKLLGVLDLSFTHIKIFPEFLCDLSELKFLGLKGCKFSELPKKIIKLINLQHLSAEPATYAMIREVGKLTSLLNLRLFRVRRAEGYHVSELKNLNQISETMEIENLELPCPSEAKDAALYKKKNLRRLVLTWDVKSSHLHNSGVFEKLEQPENLQELRIYGYSLPSVPRWVGQGPRSQNLRNIEFVCCRGLDRLPPLGSLPHLKSVLLKGLQALKAITDAFYGNKLNVFQSLEEFVLYDMPNLEKWTGLKDNQQMPKLRKVQILKCKSLCEAPLSSFNAPLLDLLLSDCPLVLKSCGSCLNGLQTVKYLTIEKSSELINLPWDSLSAVEVLNIKKCEKLSLDGAKMLCNVKKVTIDDASFIESLRMSLYKKSDIPANASSVAPAGENNMEICSESSSHSAEQTSFSWMFTDPTFLSVPHQDCSKFTSSVYERDHAVITQESHSFCPLPLWSKTLGAYLITQKTGADFNMYFAKMEDGSKSAQPSKDIERSTALSLKEVNSYAFVPANMTHYMVSEESASLVIFEKRYSSIEGVNPDFLVGSIDEQPVHEIPGEVFRLQTLLPTSLPYDFNIYIMDFQPGQCHSVEEIHYNEHGLLLLEGQGIYKFGGKCLRVQAGHAIWTASFVPHWYAALGETKTRYLLYQDVNRHPLL